MGCGQSKILHRKSRSDKNDKHNYAHDDSDGSDSRPDPEATESTEGGPEQAENENQDSAELENSPSLLEASEISTSQIEFFKMLDEKIESGPDYEEDEIDREQERQRRRRMLQDWLRRPQLDTQRFPTAYQPCPPTRTPHRVCPRPPLYPQARAYHFGRAASVESSEMQYHDPYTDPRREDSYTYGPISYQPVTEQYTIPSEPPYGYSRMLANPPSYGAPIESPEIMARNRAMLVKTAGRAMSFDVNSYSRGLAEPQDCFTVGSSGGIGPTINDYLPRQRDVLYTQQYQHPAHIQQLQYLPYAAGPDGGPDQMQYMTRPPPREMPPLQGAPGPPHGSPRPLAVRIPTSAAWRRPRGPVTELA